MKSDAAAPDRIALRPREVASMLSVCERTVRTWIAEGSLKALRKGRVVLITRAAVAEFLRDLES